MKVNLLTRFLVIYILAAALALTFIATCSYRMVYSDRLAALENDLYATASRLSGEYKDNFTRDELTSKENSRIFSEVKSSLGCNMVVITKAGDIIYPLSGDGKHITDFDPTISDKHHGFSGSAYDYFEDTDICVYSPVITGYVTTGYIILYESSADLNVVVNQALNTAYIAAGVVFLLFLPLLLFLYIWVIRPARKLKTAAKEYTGGNFTYELKYKSGDELGDLAGAMTFMAKELGRTGEDQKKFITNVSHDFRSPLTSIRGYIDAMLDGTIPPSMQGKYLNVVKDETERLTKLTQSLLDLNTISSDGTLLELTDFDVHHIVKKILATFEGRCSARGIHFELSLISPEFYVHADEGKIQQVLYNLIDNAIKFSPQDSTIFIETSEKKDKAYISVKDQGVGISAENLKKIWDRFYKADSSRGRDKKGLGLGLSIVKDIIKAHGENIDVISTEGVGTEFRFTLPLGSKVEGEEK